MKACLYILLGLICCLPTALDAQTYRVAFGSCYYQDNPNLPIWDSINKQQPDMFIFLGDNVYIDSDDPDKFQQDYEMLFSNPGISELRKNATIMATWDDHDYGLNDGGKHFASKQIAKAAFVGAFDYPELHNIPNEQGIYHSRIIKHGDKSIRFILLDTRWYRDPLLENHLSQATRERFELGPYRPHLDESKELLGEVQWQWLETILKKPVDLNIIISSIQVVTEYTAWETWANFPHERKRMLDLLERHSAGKSIIFSGDVHRGEISMLPMNGWDLYEITSSGLSADMYPGKPNIHRLGQAYSVNHFANLLIANNEGHLAVTAELYNQAGKTLASQAIPLNHQD